MLLTYLNALHRKIPRWRRSISRLTTREPLHQPNGVAVSRIHTRAFYNLPCGSTSFLPHARRANNREIGCSGHPRRLRFHSYVGRLHGHDSNYAASPSNGLIGIARFKKITKHNPGNLLMTPIDICMTGGTCPNGSGDSVIGPAPGLGIRPSNDAKL